MADKARADTQTIERIIQGQKIAPPEHLAATLAILSPLINGPWGNGQPWRDPGHRARALAPFVPRLIRCQRNHDVDQQVACRFADYVVRVAAPGALDKFPRGASALRNLSPIVDRATAMLAVRPTYEVSKVIPRFIAASTTRVAKAAVEEASWSANYAGVGDVGKAAISAGISAMKCVDFEQHACALLEFLCDCYEFAAKTQIATQSSRSEETGGGVEYGQCAPKRETFEDLIEAAERGDAEAQVKLGVAYRLGQGCTQDDTLSVQWSRRAAEQENDRGQTLLASAYAEGRGIPKDVLAAAAWYRRAAEQGNAIAQRQLGIASINGDGVQRNAKEAAKWYRLAAEQGDTVAQIGLGTSYYRGDGVPQDYAEAAKWYERAAGSGAPNAQVRLADMYARGVGVAEDKVTALMWLMLAGDGVTDDNREIAATYRAQLTSLLSAVKVAEARRRALAWEPCTWPSDPLKDALARMLPRDRPQ